MKSVGKKCRGVIMGVGLVRMVPSEAKRLSEWVEWEGWGALVIGHDCKW